MIQSRDTSIVPNHLEVNRELRQTFRRWLVLALTVGLVLSTMIPASASVVDELRELQQKQQGAQSRLGDIQSSKGKKQREFNSLNTSISRKEQELLATQKDLGYLESQLSATEKMVSEAELDLKDAEGRLKVRTKLLSARVRAMYEVGTVNYLDVLLNSANFSDFLGRFRLLKDIVGKDVELFQQVKAERRLIAEKKSLLEQKRATIASLKEQTAAKKQVIEAQKVDLDRQKNAVSKDLVLLEAQEDEEIRLAEEYGRQIAEIQAKLRRAGGKLSMIWPVRGLITSPFGNRVDPILRKWKYHNGLDIGVPMGTPVKAAESGEVIISSYLTGYGNTVVIDHGGGISTWYAHNSRFKVSVGQEVKQGDVIALAGSTGYSTGPHVHFEVRDKGIPKQPLDWLP